MLKNPHDMVKLFQDRYDHIEQTHQLKQLHRDRQVLSTLRFTPEQLERYNTVVAGINARLRTVMHRRTRG